MGSRSGKSNQNQVSIETEATPDRVFAALINVASHTDWARGPQEIRNLSENPARLVTTFQQVGKIVGRTLVAECGVNLYDENRRFGLSGDKPFPFHIAWEIEPSSGGTELTMTGSFEPGGFFNIATPILNNSLESQMKSDLLTLKAVFEAEE